MAEIDKDQIIKFKTIDYSNSDLNNIMKTHDNIRLFYDTIPINNKYYAGLRVKNNLDSDDHFTNIIRITSNSNNEIIESRIGGENNFKIDYGYFINLGTSDSKVENGYFENLNVDTLKINNAINNRKIGSIYSNNYSNYFNSISNDTSLLDITNEHLVGFYIKTNGICQIRFRWTNNNEIQLKSNGQLQSSLLIATINQEFCPYMTSSGISDYTYSNVDGICIYRFKRNSETSLGEIYLDAIIGNGSTSIAANSKFMCTATYITYSA